MKRFISWLWKYLKPFTNWRFTLKTMHKLSMSM